MLPQLELGPPPFFRPQDLERRSRLTLAVAWSPSVERASCFMLPFGLVSLTQPAPETKHCVPLCQGVPGNGAAKKASGELMHGPGRRVFAASVGWSTSPNIDLGCFPQKAGRTRDLS